MIRRPDIGETETGGIVRRPRLPARMLILAGLFLALAFGSLHARPLDGFAISAQKRMTVYALPQKARFSLPSGQRLFHARVQSPRITPAWERKGQKAIFHGIRHKYHPGKRITARARIRLARMLEFRPPRRAAPPPRPPRLRVPRRPPPGLRASPPRRVPRPPATARPRIAPSTALQMALQQMPGSLGLGVELLPGPRPVYSVKLKTGNRIHRVLVDAMNGRILNR